MTQPTVERITTCIVTACETLEAALGIGPYSHRCPSVAHPPGDCQCTGLPRLHADAAMAADQIRALRKRVEVLGKIADARLARIGCVHEFVRSHIETAPRFCKWCHATEDVATPPEDAPAHADEDDIYIIDPACCAECGGKHPSRPAPATPPEATDGDFCGKSCDHGSPCLLYADHQPPDRHETQHGCIFYDPAPASPPATAKEPSHG